jgi:selenide,water dikinase
MCSINTGSTPSHIEVPGSKQYALAVKPINEFLLGWEKLMQNALQSNGEFKVVVVGSGAGE